MNYRVGLGGGVPRASEFISSEEGIEILLPAALDDHRKGVGRRRRKAFGGESVGGGFDIGEVVGTGILDA
ncbi:hypothetical protein [Phenylobacterium sp.]|uniref:hypothetical protein n=1 Tax=Phenylobacterium sp. TaxID=1871053 RepID=UPI000BDC2FC6|nr:hypothetical protein [Phenylobacterium sp.]MDP1873171.1 hypothetical protein [Phenylobacterium sp.]OYW91368.1 MAG: hypothetical protein B7Z13_12730 [Caulobacterales bacterium 32-67-6]